MRAETHFAYDASATLSNALPINKTHSLIAIYSFVKVVPFVALRGLLLALGTPTFADGVMLLTYH